MGERIVVVGAGDVGRRVAGAAEALGMQCAVATRGSPSPFDPGERGVPVVLCVREDDLPGVLAQVPPERGGDLVFVQNGFIDELLEPFPEATRAVLWFAAKGRFFADLLPSPVFGPRRDLVARLIRAVGATAESLADAEVFRRHALEKAVWACVVGAPLAVWDCDLATARHERAGQLHALVTEACATVRAARGADVPAARVLAILDDTSAALATRRGSTRGVAYRNGKVVAWGARYGIATPENAAVVAALGATGG